MKLSYIILGGIMYFKCLCNDQYRIIIDNTEINNINIFDNTELKQFIGKILPKYLKRITTNGFLTLDIYWNNYFGMILEIKKEKRINKLNYIDMNIKFHLNSDFLYKIDYFDLKELSNIKKQKVYFYKNNYYLKLINPISLYDHIKLMDYSEIVYSDYYDIIHKGIKLYI